MEIIVLIVFFLTVTGAQGSQLEGPQNTLSVVGSNATLTCLSPSRNCSGIEWLKLIPGTSFAVFNYRGVIHSDHRERFRVDNSSGGCHLMIENVKLTDAGRFICRAMYSSNTVEKTADLIILDSQPSCSTNASLNETVEGDGVRLTCEVTYNATNRATMIWNGVEDAPAAVEKNKTISLSYSAVASEPEVQSFICNISYAVETRDSGGKEIKGLASNIPVTTCETPAVKVHYSVRSANLSPSFAIYSPGTIISCTAEGNPAPSFKWQTLEPEINATWQDIPNATHHLFTPSNGDLSHYRCVATNVVMGKNHTAISTVFQILQSEFTDELTSNTTSRPTSEDRLGTSEDRLGVSIGSGVGGDTGGGRGVAIGIGVGIGSLALILLATIIFVIFVKPRFLKSHPKPDEVVLPMEQEISLSSHQLSVMYASISETEAPLVHVGEDESAYARLQEDRDVIEYESLGERRNSKHEKKSKP